MIGQLQVVECEGDIHIATLDEHLCLLTVIGNDLSFATEFVKEWNSGT